MGSWLKFWIWGAAADACETSGCCGSGELLKNKTTDKTRMTDRLILLLLIPSPFHVPDFPFVTGIE
jgi:hypothetical protein